MVLCCEWNLSLFRQPKDNIYTCTSVKKHEKKTLYKSNELDHVNLHVNCWMMYVLCDLLGVVKVVVLDNLQHMRMLFTELLMRVSLKSPRCCPSYFHNFPGIIS